MQINVLKIADTNINDTIELIDAPALTGSEKQIAWGTDARLRLVAEQMTSFRLRARRQLDDAKYDAGVARMAAAVATKTEAKFWIDLDMAKANHSISTREIAAAIVK